MMQKRELALYRLLEKSVAVLGFELLGVQLLGGGQHTTLRVYIDGPDGITVDNCAGVSHQVSGVLDVEDPIAGEYTLEVSSPGLERPLFTPAHFLQFEGAMVKVKLITPFEGRRKFSGRLIGCDDERVGVLEDDVEWQLPLDRIGFAHIVPEI